MPTVWNDLYWKTWSGILPDESYVHPAKFAPGLIYRIYRYMRYELKIRRHSNILDPFAGVATGALWAMLHNYNWLGHEIERNFYELGRDNIFIWQKEYGKAYNLGDAAILNRDSTIGPYTYKPIQAVVSSPPFGRGETRNRSNYQDGEIASQMNRAYTIDNQGSDKRNLAAFKENDDTFQAIVSSPPYVNVISKGHGPGIRFDPKHHKGEFITKLSNATDYGNAANQMGNTTAEDFWSMAAQVVKHSYNALAPGGWAIWVCKDFVRNKERYPFSDKWQQLCQAHGFELYERIYANLITDHGIQVSMFRNDNDENLPVDDHRIKERKTFFRRQAERNGSPRIDHEDVIVMRKPQGKGDKQTNG